MCRCRWCALLEGVLSDGSSVAAEALWLLQMESCADRRTSCAWSSCPTCQYVTCTRHACVRAVVRRAVRSAWVALRGLSVEGGYGPTLRLRVATVGRVLGVMHRSHVAPGRDFRVYRSVTGYTSNC